MALVITQDSPGTNDPVTDLFVIRGHVLEDGLPVQAQVAMFDTDSGEFLGSVTCEADGSFQLAVNERRGRLRAAIITPVGAGKSRRASTIQPAKLWTRRASVLNAGYPPVDLHLLAEANNDANSPPATAEYTNAPAFCQTAASFAQLRRMRTTPSAGPIQSHSYTTLTTTTGNQYAAIMRWATVPLAAGSFFHASRGVMWNFPAEISQAANTGMLIQFNRTRCYVWRPSTQAIVKTLWDAFMGPHLGASALWEIRAYSWNGSAWSQITNVGTWDGIYGVMSGVLALGGTTTTSSHNVGGTLRYWDPDGALNTNSVRFLVNRSSPAAQNPFVDAVNGEIQNGDVLVFELASRGAVNPAVAQTVTIKTDGVGAYNTMTGPAMLKFWEARLITL